MTNQVKDKKPENAILTEIQYFPPVAYWMELVRHKRIIFEASEHYQKGSYRNRLQLMGPNGLQMLSIPLRKGKNEQMPIRDVRIAYDEPWQMRHWRTIRTTLGRAPFFEYYAEYFAPFYQELRPQFLFDLHLEILTKLFSLLGIKMEIEFTETYQPSLDAGIYDARNRICPVSTVESQFKKYGQVFEDRHGFTPNLSILDLLCCTGPDARKYLVI